MTARRRSPGATTCCAGLLLAGLLLAAPDSRADDRDPAGALSAAPGHAALHAIAREVCAALMTGETIHRRLNAYQLTALAALDLRDAAGHILFSFFHNGNTYCRHDGRAVWATVTADERLPPREILALQSPPVRVLDVQFTRVAPPSPADEPDRLQAASQAAKGALAEESGTAADGNAGGYDLTAGAAAAPAPLNRASLNRASLNRASLASGRVRGGPQAIIPSSPSDVAGSGGPAAPVARPSATSGTAPGVSRR